MNVLLLLFIMNNPVPLQVQGYVTAGTCEEASAVFLQELLVHEPEVFVNVGKVIPLCPKEAL